jgi:hypothetical protein
MSGLPPPDNMEEDETPQNPHTPLVLSYHLDGMYNSIRSIQPQYMTSNPGYCSIFSIFDFIFL